MRSLKVLSTSAQPKSCRPGKPKTRCTLCRAATVEAWPHTWEQVERPSLHNGGSLASEEVRVRSFEVGSNQQAGIVTVSNMLQVCVGCVACQVACSTCSV